MSAVLLSFGAACTDQAEQRPLEPTTALAENMGEPGTGGALPEPDAAEGPAPGDAPGEVNPEEQRALPIGPGSAAGSGSTGGPTPEEPEPVTWGPVPPLRSPVALPDAELAVQALTLLGSSAVGARGSCGSCHALGRPTLTRWSQLTAELTSACLGDAQLPDVAAVDAKLDCFRQRGGKPAARFTPQVFGIYAAAAQLPWFRFLFEHATPLGSGTTSHDEFVTRVGMPLAGQPWTQAEFDVVAEWFARRLPRLFELVPEEPGEACTAALDPELSSYLDTLAVSGWRAKNAQLPLLMYGCAPGQSGSACLADLPLASALLPGTSWDNVPGAQTRILHDNSELLSFYWSRASADGRYIGAGVLEPALNDGYPGQILDLQEQRSIPGVFSYDATFFPDNSGFLMQQSGYESFPFTGRPVALICQQSLLGELPEDVTGEEPGCTLAQDAFGLYQHPAKSLDGADLLVAHGIYQADNGGFAPTLQQPSASFDARSRVALTPLLNTGDGFDVGQDVVLVTPQQGDPVLSPSGGLLALRVKGREYTTTSSAGAPVIAAEQSGYALYRLTQEGGQISARDLGRVCLSGGKPTFSYDERWLVFHHYVEREDAQELGSSDPSDPGFAPYLQRGASNLMLVDLRTGAARRITHMAPGQYAVFPHFRSDGWIYFVVRTLQGAEYFAASDAALVLEAGGSPQ